MRAYSMDLQERALLDSDAGMKVADVAAKYRVSGSWVRLLKQRRRETGEVAPRVQRHGRRGMLEPHLHTLADLIAAHPDRTLAELKDALATPEQVAAGALEQPPAANTDRPPRRSKRKSGSPCGSGCASATPAPDRLVINRNPRRPPTVSARDMYATFANLTPTRKVQEPVTVGETSSPRRGRWLWRRSP